MLGEVCFTTIGSTDIKGSKSEIIMNTWLQQATYPCSNFSGTYCRGWILFCIPSQMGWNSLGEIR